jgi:large subunit ribosomal protein L6
MSRIGRRPIEIPKGVQVTIGPANISAKGPKGSLNMPKHQAVSVKEVNGALIFERKADGGSERAAHGLIRALCANMLVGVTKGFEKQLEINGVGYKAEIKGSNITFALGYSHPIDYKLPDGVAAKMDKNVLTLSGIDRQVLGAAAAKIRSFRPPEPYKGKGIKYSTETILRKAGKTAGK